MRCCTIRTIITDMETHELLKQVREETGYSYEKMAKLCGVKEQHYRKYERGERVTGLLETHAKVLDFLLRKRLLVKFYKEVKNDERNNG